MCHAAEQPAACDPDFSESVVQDDFKQWHWAESKEEGDRGKKIVFYLVAEYALYQ